MKRWLPLPLLLLAALFTMGHVGSPNVFFQGAAGPYEIRAVVRPPEAVPGAAEVSVRVASPGARQVLIRPARWDAGLEGAPPPEPAQPVRGVPGLYNSQVWLLTASSYALEIAVEGRAGHGHVTVPVAAAPVRQTAMSGPVGALLGSLLVLLLVGGVQLAGAAVREATLEPGELPGPERRSRARITAGGAVLLAVLYLLAGRSWWERVDSEHRGAIYRPFNLSAEASAQGAQRLLALQLDDPRWLERRAQLATDHGKLMHLFLLREPGYDAFAHLHPVPILDHSFEAALPELPGGTYRLYADVTEETGYAHTLIGRVEIPLAPRPEPGAELVLAPDPDDSWHHAAPLGRETAPNHRTGRGLTLVWRDRQPLVADRETTLRFSLVDEAGRPASLEPYMGMWGHAVLARDDGQVFVHLHPSGSISMAAQRLFETRWRGQGDPHAGHGSHAASSEISFPYAFPEPGSYRVWIQTKSGGEVLTGVFDVQVAAAP
jgi:hypothetical protein